ncbi:Protein fam72a [Gonapodya sp. JEL0774]|nr:Protein fam72a [Gonapodya sp. JEL0774]
MKAILLADTTVELYSTDSPPFGVQLVGDDYTTRNCYCRIRDVGCVGCGNVVGYHVTQPWMFHTSEVRSSERLDPTGKQILTWAHLPRVERDVGNRRALGRYEEVCR